VSSSSSRRIAASRCSEAGGRSFGLGVDHGQLDAAQDMLVAGPGQEGEGVLPGAWPRSEPAVKVVLGAFAELASGTRRPRRCSRTCCSWDGFGLAQPHDFVSAHFPAALENALIALAPASSRGTAPLASPFAMAVPAAA